MEFKILRVAYTEVKETAGVRWVVPTPGQDFHELASFKESNMVEGRSIGEYIHMCLCIPSKYALSNVAGYIKGKMRSKLP